MKVTYYDVWLNLGIPANNEEEAIEKFCDRIAIGKFKREHMGVEFAVIVDEDSAKPSGYFPKAIG